MTGFSTGAALGTVVGRSNGRGMLDDLLPAPRAREVDMPDQVIPGRPEELLARSVMKLARRNDALEEFAALVAHEVKAPLQAALATDDPVVFVRQALDLV